MLLPIPDLLPRDEALRLRDLLREADWRPGRATAGGLAASVKENLQLSSDDPRGAEAAALLVERLERHPEFISAALPRRIYPPRFNCHRDGGHYGPHVDSALLSLPGGGRMRGDLSATLFLSDPADYDGGELWIETPMGVQAVKLPAGQLVLYPATSLHEVRPVTRGERICAFFWVESLVREAHRRELLYDLDQSIRALARQGANRDELARLGRIYHNLLRDWVQT